MKDVITFFGGEAKAGTTMLCQSFAEELALKGKRVLLIFASSELYDNYMQIDETAGLDDLRELEEVTMADVKRLIRKKGDLSFIKGVERPFLIRYFSVELIQKICDAVGNDYDYIVVDGGSNYQYPLPVSALNAATKRYYVLTAKARCVARFRTTHTLLLKSPAVGLTERDEIILNKYIKNAGAYSQDDVASLFSFKVSTVPKASAGSTCEVTRQTIAAKAYRQSIKALCDKFLSERKA